MSGVPSALGHQERVLGERKPAPRGHRAECCARERSTHGRKGWVP